MLLLLLNAAAVVVAPTEVLTGRPYRKGLGWRPWKDDRFETVDEPAPFDGPSPLIAYEVQAQYDRLAAEANVLRIEQAAAQAREAVLKAQRTTRARKAARDLAAQEEQARQVRAAYVAAEMQRIAQEIEELDVAYLVALMD